MAATIDQVVGLGVADPSSPPVAAARAMKLTTSM